MMNITRTVIAFSAALLVSALIVVQTNGQGSAPGSIRGRVFMPDGKPVTEAVKVTLRLLRGDQIVMYTDSDGLFEMNGVAPGSYTVEAEADRERSKYDPGTERVQVFPRQPSLVAVYLREKGDKERTKPAAGTVPAEALDRKVPSGAVEEFGRATKAGNEGKLEEAIRHLRKALAIYPDYLMARNDLGSYLLAQGKLDEASDELLAAVKIDAKAFNPRLNLGIVRVRQQRFPEAAESLNAALSLNANSPAAHLYAGLAYVGLRELERAEKELSTAYELGGNQYALAQFHLGQLYLDKGERALALKAFETYLRDQPDAANAEQVRRLISILR